jgi:hypothetical protein
MVIIQDSPFRLSGIDNESIFEFITLLLCNAGIVGDKKQRLSMVTGIMESWRTSPAATESRFPVGSSASKISSVFASARAMATRCCSPPESKAGAASPLC